jgi:TldD protein
MNCVDEFKIFDDTFMNQIDQGIKCDYWDLRAGISTGTSLEFTDLKSKEISSYDLTGCSIRTYLDGGWGFLVLNDINKGQILEGFKKATQYAKFSAKNSKEKYEIKKPSSITKKVEIKSKRSINDVDIDEKIHLTQEQEKNAADFSKEVKNTRTLYLDRDLSTLFIDSNGTKISQRFEIVRLFSSVYVQANGVIQNSTNSIGGVGGFEIVETGKARNISELSASQAIELLSAKSPIGGKFRVIMDPKLTGTFIHEALGHACEADLVLNKESILSDKMGQQIAVDDVNIYDDPTFGHGKKLNLPYELFGSYFFDDEGIIAQKTEIIKNGIFKSFLHNLETASRMNVPPNGHGRANSIVSKPQVRMGFTYLEPKNWSLEEMIEDTKNGILCEDFKYGYTDPTTGNFQFKCRVSRIIENGQLKDMMRDVALGGLTLEILKKISAIGNEDNFGYSDGICGKGGQGIRVCDGGPYIRVEDVTIGGLN